MNKFFLICGLAFFVSGASVLALPASYTYTATTRTGGAAQSLYYSSNPTGLSGLSTTTTVTVNGLVALAGGITFPTAASGSVLQLGTLLPFSGTLSSGGLSYATYVALTRDLFAASNFSLVGQLKLWGTGQLIKLSGDLTINSASVTVTTQRPAGFSVSGTPGLIIDGGGNTVTIAKNGSGVPFTLGNNISVTFRNMNLVLDCAVPFTYASNAFVTFDNVTIKTTGNRLLGCNNQSSVKGPIFIANDVVITGSRGNLLTYGSVQPMTVLSGGSLTITDNVVYQSAHAPTSTSGDMTIYQAPTIKMTDGSSTLKLDQCALQISASPGSTSPGLQILGGRVIFDNMVKVINTGATSATVSSGTNNYTSGFLLGDGSANNNVDIIVNSCATVIVDGFMQQYSS